MAPLIKTNAYLADPRVRRAMIRRSVLDSSLFEGATGLGGKVAKVRTKASKRKRAKGS